MRNEFFVERYAHEKHQAHLGEAAHDRLLGTTRTGEQRQIGRALRAQAARTLAGIAALIAFAAHVLPGRRHMALFGMSARRDRVRSSQMAGWVRRAGNAAKRDSASDSRRTTDEYRREDVHT